MDETILYAGDQILQAGYPGAKETIARFAAHAGCDANNPVMGPRLDVLVDGNDAETNVTRYTACPDGVEVVSDVADATVRATLDRFLS